MSKGFVAANAACPYSFGLRHRVRRMKRILKLAPSTPARVGARVGDRTDDATRTSPSPCTRPGRCRDSVRKVAEPDPTSAAGEVHPYGPSAALVGCHMPIAPQVPKYDGGTPKLARP